MNRIVRPAGVMLALLLAACSQFDVRSRSDPDANFSALRTYAWMPLSEVAPADQRVLDRFIDTRIRTDVDTELGAKGYRPATEVAAADFLLNYRLASEPAEGAGGDPERFFYGAGWSGWVGAAGFYADTYSQGTLYLAVIDARARKMIWLGAANARLLPSISIERRARRVDDAIHKILEKFPARQG